MVSYKKYIIIFFALCLVTVFSLFKKNTDFNNRNNIIVGVMSDYPPYCQGDATGKLVGFDCDVAQQIGIQLQKKVVFQDMDLAALLIALQQNKIDCIISGLSITQEREQAMAMVYYQGNPTITYPLVFWKTIPVDIKGIEDLQKYPDAFICVEAGSSQEKFLLQFPRLVIRNVDRCSDIVMDLKYGKSLAALMDPDIFPTIKQKNPELQSIEINLPEQFQSKGCGIAIKSNNTALILQITKAIADLLSNGTIQQLEQQWFQGDAL